MAFVGGDILEITWNHPTIGSGVLFPKAGEDSTFDPGGFRGDDDDMGLAGNGEAIRKINQKKWSFEHGAIAWDMAIAQELESMRQLSGSPEQAQWTITHSNGTIYSGKGSPVGDLQGNGNASTFSLKIQGSGILKKQA